MHRRIVIAIGVAAVAACGGRAYPDATSSATLTSASVGPSGAETVSDRIARAVCIHEVECGRARDPGLCVDGARMRTAKELAAWTCDETSARASAEGCLATVRTAPCSLDLGAGNVCPQNGGCATIEGEPAASR